MEDGQEDEHEDTVATVAAIATAEDVGAGERKSRPPLGSDTTLGLPCAACVPKR